jgi:hypothetical protein
MGGDLQIFWRLNFSLKMMEIFFVISSYEIISFPEKQRKKNKLRQTGDREKIFFQIVSKARSMGGKTLFFLSGDQQIFFFSHSKYFGSTNSGIKSVKIETANRSKISPEKLLK